MIKKIIWLSTLILALTIGQQSIACSAENKSKNCHCGEKKLSNSLNLTDDQKLKIKALRIQSRNALKTNYQQLKALRNQINAMVKMDKIDEGKLDSLIAQRNKIKAVMMKSHIMMRHQICSLLTDKQKIQFNEMKKKREANH